MHTSNPLPYRASRSDTELATAARLAEGGRADLALDVYRRILERDVTTAEAWYRKGLLHSSDGEAGLAIVALRQSIALRPTDPWPCFQLAQIIWSTGIARRWESIALFRRAFEIDPGCDEFRLNLGNALAAVNSLGEAFHILKSLPATLPSWWASARDNAVAAYHARRHELRTILLNRRSSTDKTLPPAQRVRTAALLAMLGKADHALRLTRRLMREHPHTWDTFAIHANILAERRGPATAVRFLDSIDWLFSESAPFELMLARYRYESGANDEAWAALTPPVRSSSQEARALASSVLLSLGQGDALLTHCREWIRDTPDDTAPYMFAIAAQRTRGVLRTFDEMSPEIAHPTQFARFLSIVQFWDAAVPPAEVQATMNSWRDKHPEMRHVVYSESTAREYLARHYGNAVVACFSWCHHAAMKSDLFRIAYLAREGGVYVDADEYCRRPISPLLRELESSELIAALSADVAPYLYNAFLLARPGSRVMQSTLAAMLDGLGHGMRSGRHPDIWHATGPGILTRTVGGLLATDDTASASLLLLTKGQYASFTSEIDTLAYKQTQAGNWRLSASRA